MQTFEIETPDGRKFRIEAPEGATQEQVMAFVQQNEAARAERIAAATAADQARIRQEFKDSMSPLEKFIIGGGRGFTDLGQGIKQLGLNAGAAVGLVDDKTAEDYNAAVREEAAMYERDLGDSFAAGAGRVGAQIAATLPLGGAGAGYVKGGTTLMSQLGRAGLVGAATGGGTSALNAVTEEGDYWTQKAQQAGTGAAFGGVLGAAGQGVVRGLQGVANAPRRLVNEVLDVASPQTPQSFDVAIKLAQEAGDAARVAQLQEAAQKAMRGGFIGQMLRGSQVQQRLGDRAARQTGVNLSPGQRSGNPVANQLENWARQSLLTRWKMFKSDFARGRQMVNSIRSLGRQIGGEDVAPETFAQQLQGTVKNMVGDLAKRRTEVAGGAYREIDRLAGDARIVQSSNVLDEAAKLAKEFEGSSSDAAQIRGWAERFFNGLDGDGTMTASRAISELQGFEKAARTGVGLFDDIKDRSTAKTAAQRLARAIMRDLDEAENVGGNVGEQLREANRLWRSYSSEIDNVEASALGRIVGDDLVGELSGIAQNTTSPERVLDILDGLSATELGVVKDYLLRTNPQLWQQFQRTTLDRAASSARAAAPSMGKRPLPINPAAFVRNLEGTSGKQAEAQMKRLEVIFGEGAARDQLRSILEVGRRMSDMTGYNHSGSGVFQETSGLLQGMLNPVKQGLATVGGLGTLQIVARGAQPGAARVPLRMLEAPFWATTATVIPVGGLAAGGVREVMNVPGNDAELTRALAEYQRQKAGQSR